MFGLSSFNRRDVVRHLIVIFYLYEGDSNKQDIFDPSKMSNYDH